MFDTAYYLEQLTPTALAPLLANWAIKPPCGLFALVAEGSYSALANLQIVCRARSIPLLGGIFPGLIYERRFVYHGAWLLQLPAVPLYALLNDLAHPDAAQRIAATLAIHPTDAAANLLLLFDAQLPNIASLLAALYLELGDTVRYFGANAGNEHFQTMPCLFDQTRQLGDSVLCLVLPTHWHSALAHGYLAPAVHLLATAASGNRIISINWQPAFTVYRAKVWESYHVALNRENFYYYAVHFPFGILLANGEILVRVPVALDSAGAIVCIGEIPPQALLTLLQSPTADALDTVQTLLTQLPPVNAAPCVLFYCAGRRLHLGAGAERELAACADRCHAPLVGALTLGEIGNLTTGAYPQFHNASLLGLRWDVP